MISRSRDSHGLTRESRLPFEVCSKKGYLAVTQQSPKKITGSTDGGLELHDGGPIGFQVIRPQGQSPIQQPANDMPAQHQIGQGIVPVGQPAPLVRHEPQFANDDISTFFRNRQMVAQGSFGLSPILKFLIFVCIVGAAFLFGWNYAAPVRTHTQSYVDKYFDLNLADYVPVWTKKAKAFHKLREKEYLQRQQEASRASSASSAAPIDSIYTAVTSGLWPRVESYVTSKCPRWSASSGCAVRAWYLSYRGQRPTLRSISGIGADQMAKLTTRERAVFRLAMSILADGPQSEQLFQQALELTTKDPTFQRMLVDARLKWLLKDYQPKQMETFIAKIRQIPASAEDLSKWKSMELAARLNAYPNEFAVGAGRGQRKQIGETLTQHPGVFKSDPVAFIGIAGPALRLGLAKEVTSIADALAMESFQAGVDPSLRREIYLLGARGLMLQGDLQQAAERIKALQKKDGSEAVGNHLLGSIYLEMRSSARLSEAIQLFSQAAQARNAWQSYVGLLLAQTRLGKIADGNRTAATLASLKTSPKSSASEHWIQVAINEYKMAVAKTGGDLSLSRYKEIANSLSGLYARYPLWRYLASTYAEALENSGQRAEAEKVRLKMDDESSKKSYLTSSEFLESPFGPYVFMR